MEKVDQSSDKPDRAVLGVAKEIVRGPYLDRGTDSEYVPAAFAMEQAKELDASTHARSDAIQDVDWLRQHCPPQFLVALERIRRALGTALPELGARTVNADIEAKIQFAWDRESLHDLAVIARQLVSDLSAMQRRAESAEADWQQETDIRTDRETMLQALQDAIKVPAEPHQTYWERLLEAAGAVSASGLREAGYGDDDERFGKTIEDYVEQLLQDDAEAMVVGYEFYVDHCYFSTEKWRVASGATMEQPDAPTKVEFVSVPSAIGKRTDG